MQITSNQLIQARETVTTLLDEIGLENYMFEIKPQQGRWDINLECNTDQGWECIQLSANEEYIVRGKDDAVLHQFLIDEWSEQLKHARRRKLSKQPV